MNQKISLYNTSVKKKFSFMKNSSSFNELDHKRIELENLGSLIPLSNVHSENSKIIENICAWRNKFRKTFLRL